MIPPWEEQLRVAKATLEAYKKFDLRLEAQKQYERDLQEFGPDVDELIIQAMLDESD